VINAEDSNNIAAFQPSCLPVPGWPKFTGGWTVWTPAVGDVFGNGRVEVSAITREGELFLWNTPGKPSGIEAWSWHQNDWHTGRYGDDTRPPLRPRRMTLAGAHRLCWIAPGGDWGDGQAARYQLRAFTARARPAAQTFASGRPLPSAPAPAPAGTGQCMTVRGVGPGNRWVALRAVDSAGLISYPAVARLP
jgi:hypothetical protein